MPPPASSSKASIFADHNYRAYFVGNWCGDFGMQIQGVAIAWHVFVLTKSALYLGMVGLMLFLPCLLFVFVAGHIADGSRRLAIVVGGRIWEFACALGFLALIFTHVHAIAPYLAVVFLLGCSRALTFPALRTILPNIVPASRYMEAAATFSSARQLSVIGGPALGGALLVFSTEAAFASASVMGLIAAFAFGTLRMPKFVRAPEPSSWTTVTAGLTFIRAHPIILGAIGLDLFAVLFGGATALLPIYADSILHVGPAGLGLLRAAPAVGAAVMGFLIARRPIERAVGLRLFTVVVGFGVTTIVFGISNVLWLSLVALAVRGAFDINSVVIRSSLVQLNTPDAMRGRVSAIESIFIVTANEFGTFFSGTTGQLMGTIPSVVLGGAGTLIVAAVFARAFPALRNADRIRQEAAA